MGFFDETLDASWLARPRALVPDAPWVAPPHDLIPAYLAFRLDVWRTVDLAIWIVGTAVYPCGALFELHIRWGTARRITQPLIPGDKGREGLCLGLLLGDGAKLLATPRNRQSREIRPHTKCTLVVAPLRARPQVSVTELWLWSLPRDDVTWIIEWRAQRVPESRVSMSCAALLAAVRDVQAAWLTEDGRSARATSARLRT
jgi:hypothetical protein